MGRRRSWRVQNVGQAVDVEKLRMVSGDTIDERKARDFYHRLRERLDAWLETRAGRACRFGNFLLLLPDIIHLVIRLALDRRVPSDLRAQTAAVLAYVVLPFDLVPEGLFGPVGFADDLLLAALMVNRLLTSLPPEIVLEHWAGPSDLIVTIRRILDAANEIVGSQVWKRLQKFVGGRQV